MEYMKYLPCKLSKYTLKHIFSAFLYQPISLKNFLAFKKNGPVLRCVF